MTNVNKYTVSGTIHSRGMAAIFWLKWLVTAESSKAPQAAINSHMVRSCGVGAVSAASETWFAAGGGVASGDALLPPKLIAPQTKANSRKPIDHARVCACR